MSTRRIRVLIGCLSLVILAAMALGNLRTSNAQGNPAVELLIDSPAFPGIPGRGGDCELNAFTRQLGCLDTFFTTRNTYYDAPYQCPSTPTCLLPCFFDPTGNECLGCVNDCTQARYISYYNAEQRLNTAACGVCTAQLDFCGGARAAAESCTVNYQNCGGLFVEGCWETFSQCRLNSGIDQCQ